MAIIQPYDFLVSGNLLSQNLMNRDNNNIPFSPSDHNNYLGLVRLLNNPGSYFSEASMLEGMVPIVVIEASRSLHDHGLYKAVTKLGSAWPHPSPAFPLWVVLGVLAGAVFTVGKATTNGLSPNKGPKRIIFRS